jgi:rhamnulokinase
MARFAAVDLGASSGRVIVGSLADGLFRLDEVCRFPNGPRELPDGIHWDVQTLFARIKAGLEDAVSSSGPAVVSVGVDTGGVDYGRVDADGELVEPPFHYRDSRTAGIPAAFLERYSAAELYAENGLQVSPINTVFQFIAPGVGGLTPVPAGAEAGACHGGGVARAPWDQAPAWADVVRTLFMPDLFNYWLTGVMRAEVTIASTSGLLRVAERAWSPDITAHLAQEYGVPVPGVLPELVEPGTVIGSTRPGLFSQSLQVVAVPEHDTASAVVAVPAQQKNFAYISSGTWSLVGLELDAPVLSEAARSANFTNELGADGTVRFLKNVMGMWVLNECLRNWAEQGRRISVMEAVAASERVPALSCVIDIDDERLLPPGDMPALVRQLAAEAGQQLPDDQAAVTRCVLDSLALAYRKSIRNACEFSGHEVAVVHVVGGGCQNRLLCQLTAEATGLPVVAGPVEGTALGNLLIQARAAGALQGDLFDLRKVAAASSTLFDYRPGVLGLPEARWQEAESRLR